MKSFGKANFPVAFRPTSAFPLDARCVFADLASAEAAAATAEEIGSTNTIYHYGMQLLVSDGEADKWYTIRRDGTLQSSDMPLVTAADNNKIMQVKNGVWVATPAEDYINKLIDDYLSGALNAEY